MDILPLHFRSLQICGLWYDSNKFLVLKMIYRSTVLFIIAMVIIGQLMGLATIQHNIDDLTESFFIAFTFISFWLKILNFLTRRQDLENLLNDFRISAYQSKSVSEHKIIFKYSDTAKNVYLYFLSITHISGILITLIPILLYGGQFLDLPYITYRPYKNSKISFWITFIMQVLTSFTGITLNVSMDTMAYGFMILAAGQFKLNYYRLLNSSISIKDFIIHYKLTRNTVIKIQSFFIRIIVPHFFFTLLIICCSIFQISKKQLLSFECLSGTLYITCILWEIFFYCWFGNELKLESQGVVNAIYSSNWLNYTTTERKSLWLAMIFGQCNSDISFHGQCKLSLITFLWILKTSYALFSLLKQVSN